MKIVSKLSLVVALFASLSACSYFQFPGVHKIYVQQGHIITNDMIEQLETGMTRQQVRYVLGTPLLEDPFNPDRWDYHYSLKRGDKQLRKRHLTVYFEEDKLARFEGSAVERAREAAEEEEEQPPLPTNVEENALPEPELPTDPDTGDTPLPSNTDM